MSFFSDYESCIAYDQYYNTPKGRQWLDAEMGLLNRLLTPDPRDVILDVGCGPGRHLIEFRASGIRCAGIDASPHMVELAQKRLGPFVPIESGSAESLPFEDGRFDIVLLVKTLEFVDDPIKALHEARRVARKAVFVEEVNAFSPVGLKHAFGGMPCVPFLRKAHLFDLWSLKRMVGDSIPDVRVTWASTRMEGIFGSKRNVPGPISSNPFGDLVGLRADLAQKAAVRSSAISRLNYAFPAFKPGATRQCYERGTPLQHG